MKKQSQSERVIYSIGHSTLDLEAFIAILKSFEINQVVDIRSIPRSCHNPQFNFDTFPRVLRKTRIGYRHEKKLGGLRKAKRDSINKAWENISFRGFADYMQTNDFIEGLARVLALIDKKRLVLMCAEVLPWRCHRSLIGDALLIRGIEVRDIFGFNKYKTHRLTPWAKVQGEIIFYPPTDV